MAASPCMLSCHHAMSCQCVSTLELELELYRARVVCAHFAHVSKVR